MRDRPGLHTHIAEISLEDLGFKVVASIAEAPHAGLRDGASSRRNLDHYQPQRTMVQGCAGRQLQRRVACRPGARRAAARRARAGVARGHGGADGAEPAHAAAAAAQGAACVVAAALGRPGAPLLSHLL